MTHFLLIIEPHPDKFYTLPIRKNPKTEYQQSSIDRRVRRRNSENLKSTSETPPKKPPRTFEAYEKPQATKKGSLFNIFKSSKSDKEAQPKTPRLKRSVSDAANLKSKVYGPAHDEPPFRKRSGSQTSEENISNIKATKKQLSPIIEITQREDYFAPSEVDLSNKENIDFNRRYNDHNTNFSSKDQERQRKNSGSVTDKLKEYIDEVDSVLYEETGIKVNPPKNAETKAEVVIIDVDKAEKINGKQNSKSSKLNANALGKKIKSFANKKRKLNKSVKNKANVIKEKLTNKKKKGQQDTVEEEVEYKPETIEIVKPSKVKEAIESIENQSKQSSTMIHSSQKPPEKLPLTRGRTVNTMVKRLSHDNGSPPPKSNMMTTPNASVQHNNNQPFSYTRGLSPEKSYNSPVNGDSPTHPNSPIIYAQVVCGNGSKPNKQTVHTTYVNGKKHLPHSDSDEGLGYEENSGFNTRYQSDKTVTHFEESVSPQNNYSYGKSPDFYNGTNHFEEEFPITPNFKTNGYSSIFKDYDKKFEEFLETERVEYVDSSSRGRGDGMDSKRRESLSESLENGLTSPFKTNNTSTTLNVRGDLSARRDLLESRINRKFGDKYTRRSPEYDANTSPSTNVYTAETRYYKSESKSPMGYNKSYNYETKTNDSDDRYPNDSYTKRNYKERVDRQDDDPNNRSYNYNGYSNELKSLESQIITDYRSSPENRVTDYKHSRHSKNGYRPEKYETLKQKEYHKSSPEIYHDDYVNREGYQKTYHDSLRRERYETERYLDQSEYDRKDKFGDSGIENDFRRDSGENFRVTRNVPNAREPFNDSEDEGFASSLLIASERQHTEDNFMNRKQRPDYDSDVSYRRNERDEVYRNVENMDYRYPREYKSKEYKNEYAHRERSIDDGSHYDPRLDKNADRGTLKKANVKKPPKSEKKSSLEKVGLNLSFNIFLGFSFVKIP